MFKHYKEMSKNNKVIFWQVITNLFLVVFTFWMGLFVQDFIASKNSSVNERLLQMQYNEKVMSQFEEMGNHDLLDKIYRIVMTAKSEEQSGKIRIANLMLAQHLITNSDSIESIARRSVSIMNKYRYFCLDKSQFYDIGRNNALILLYLKTKELIEDNSIKLDSVAFKEKMTEYLFSSEMRNCSFNMVFGEPQQINSIVNGCWKTYKRGNKLNCTASIIVPFIENYEKLRSSFEPFSETSPWQFSNWNTTPWQILGLGIVLLFIIINVFIYVFIPGKDMEKTLSYEDLEEELRQQKLYDIAIFQGKNREINEKTEIINEKTEIINKQNDRINEQNKVISDKIRTINELREKLKKYEGE